MDLKIDTNESEKGADNGKSDSWKVASPKSKRRKRKKKKRKRSTKSIDQESSQCESEVLLSADEVRKTKLKLSAVNTSTIDNLTTETDTTDQECEVVLKSPKTSKFSPKSASAGTSNTFASKYAEQEDKQSYADISSKTPQSPKVSFDNGDNASPIRFERPNKVYRKTPHRTEFHMQELNSLESKSCVDHENMPELVLNDNKQIQSVNGKSFKIQSLSDMVEKCNDMNAIILHHREKMESLRQQQIQFHSKFEKLKTEYANEVKERQQQESNLANEKRITQNLSQRIDQFSNLMCEILQTLNHDQVVDDINLKLQDPQRIQCLWKQHLNSYTYFKQLPQLQQNITLKQAYQQFANQIVQELKQIKTSFQTWKNDSISSHEQVLNKVNQEKQQIELTATMRQIELKDASVHAIKHFSKLVLGQLNAIKTDMMDEINNHACKQNQTEQKVTVFSNHVLQSLQNIKNISSNQINKLESKVGKLTKSKTQLQQKLNQAKTESAVNKQKSIKFAIEIEHKLTAIKSATQKEIDSLQTANDLLFAQLNAAKVTIARLGSDLQKKSQQFKEQIKFKDRIISKQQERESKNAIVLRDAANELNEIKTAIGVQQQITETNLKEFKSAVQSYLLDIRSKATIDKEKYTQLKKNNNKLSTQLLEKENQVEQLESNVASLKATLKKQEKVTQDQIKYITALSDKIDNQKAQLDENQKMMSPRSETIRLKQQINAKNLQIQQQKQDIQKLQSAMQENHGMTSVR